VGRWPTHLVEFLATLSRKKKKLVKAIPSKTGMKY
jgi:hypothetical protein